MDNNTNDFQVKITEDEQHEIVQLNADYQSTILEMGELHLTKLNLNRELDELNKVEDTLNSKYDNLKQKENLFLERLSNKYGDGILDPKTGMYIKN